MNIYVVQNPENENFLNHRYKWTPHMYKAKLFTCVSNANKARAELRDKIPVKLIVQEYELVHRTNR